MTHYTLYRIYDGDGALLYVGVTRSLATRLTRHRSRAAWWPTSPTVRTQDIGPDKQHALRVEAEAILREHPRHNSDYNPSVDRDAMKTSHLGATQLAEIFGVSRATMKRWLATGLLPSVHKLPGRTGAYVVSTADVLRLLEERAA